MALDRFALKPTEVAARLGADRSSVYRWIETGELPSFRLAGHPYVPIGAFEQFAERRNQGVTLAAQAARDIGPGEEVAGEVELLAGLELAVQPAVEPAATPNAAKLDEIVQLLRLTLSENEDRFGVPSEHVHRVRVVERQPHVEGVPDEVVDQWSRTYIAYMNLALVPAGRP